MQKTRRIKLEEAIERFRYSDKEGLLHQFELFINRGQEKKVNIFVILAEYFKKADGKLIFESVQGLCNVISDLKKEAERNQLSSTIERAFEDYAQKKAERNKLSLTTKELQEQLSVFSKVTFKEFSALYEQNESLAQLATPDSFSEAWELSAEQPQTFEQKLEQLVFAGVSSPKEIEIFKQYIEDQLKYTQPWLPWSLKDSVEYHFNYFDKDSIPENLEGLKNLLSKIEGAVLASSYRAFYDKYGYCMDEKRFGELIRAKEIYEEPPFGKVFFDASLKWSDFADEIVTYCLDRATIKLDLTQIDELRKALVELSKESLQEVPTLENCETSIGTKFGQLVHKLVFSQVLKPTIQNNLNADQLAEIENKFLALCDQKVKQQLEAVYLNLEERTELDSESLRKWVNEQVTKVNATSELSTEGMTANSTETDAEPTSLVELEQPSNFTESHLLTNATESNSTAEATKTTPPSLKVSTNRTTEGANSLSTEATLVGNFTTQSSLTTSEPLLYDSNTSPENATSVLKYIQEVGGAIQQEVESLVTAHQHSLGGNLVNKSTQAFDQVTTQVSTIATSALGPNLGSNTIANGNTGAWTVSSGVLLAGFGLVMSLSCVFGWIANAVKNSGSEDDDVEEQGESHEMHPLKSSDTLGTLIDPADHFEPIKDTTLTGEVSWGWGLLSCK